MRILLAFLSAYFITSVAFFPQIHFARLDAPFLHCGERGDRRGWDISTEWYGTGIFPVGGSQDILKQSLTMAIRGVGIVHTSVDQKKSFVWNDQVAASFHINNFAAFCAGKDGLALVPYGMASQFGSFATQSFLGSFKAHQESGVAVVRNYFPLNLNVLSGFSSIIMHSEFDPQHHISFCTRKFVHIETGDCWCNRYPWSLGSQNCFKLALHGFGLIPHDSHLIRHRFITTFTSGLHFVQLSLQNHETAFHDKDVPDSSGGNYGRENSGYPLGSSKATSSFAQTIAEALGGFICLLGALICFLTIVQFKDVRLPAAILCVLLLTVGVLLTGHAAYLDKLPISPPAASPPSQAPQALPRRT